MSDPIIAVVMLLAFILTIFLGFPICFTLMAMGVGFGYYAYYDPTRMQTIFDNRIFDLFVNQTYSVMSNDVLTAVPLFLFMGYVVERANIVDRLFQTLYISARRLPAAMAVAALITCALFATATGIVGAVVTLMGLLAFPAMLKARYDPSFASGVICAGGCLGILIPPSIMLIVYAATSNVSIVKLYAGAIFPGFMLAGLYMLYVLGRAILKPSLAPKPSKEEVGDYSPWQIAVMLLTSFFPLAILICRFSGRSCSGLRRRLKQRRSALSAASSWPSVTARSPGSAFASPSISRSVRRRWCAGCSSGRGPSRRSSRSSEGKRSSASS